MFSWGGTRAFFDKSISKNFFGIIRADNFAKYIFLLSQFFEKCFYI